LLSLQKQQERGNVGQSLLLPRYQKPQWLKYVLSFHLYIDGFRQMTWGRVLWGIILLKLFLMFVVLRLFFFRPALGGLDEQQKEEVVGSNLVNKSTDKTH